MAVPDVNIVSFCTQDSRECRFFSGAVSIVDGSGSLLDSAFILRNNPTGSGTGAAWIGGRLSTNGAQAAFSLITAYYRFYFVFETIPASSEENFAAIVGNNDSTVKLNFRITSGGNIKLVGPGGTIGTTTATISLSTLYRIEADVGTGPSGAALVFHLYAGDDTTPIETISAPSTNLSAASNGNLLLGKYANVSNNSIDVYFAHPAISSAGLIGPGRCRVVLPSADGTYTDYTIGAGAGSKWQQVDDAPTDDDTTYLLSTSVIGQAYTSIFNCQAVIPVGVNPTAVKAGHRMKRNNLTGQQRLRFRSGSTDSDTGTNFQIESNYVNGEQIFTTDPNTAAAWLRANMSALEAGVIEQDSNATRKCRLTASYMTVEYPISAAPAGAKPFHQAIIIG